MTGATEGPLVPSPRPDRRPPARCGVRRRYVLVVDDDPSVRALASLALRRAGYRVVEAHDGMDAIDRIAEARARRASAFSAILSDVCMPELSGLDVLTVLRCARLGIPVILMTAFSDRDLHAEAHLLGAAAVLAKPIDLDVLTRSIDAMVRRGPGGA